MVLSTAGGAMARDDGADQLPMCQTIGIDAHVASGAVDMNAAACRFPTVPRAIEKTLESMGCISASRRERFNWTIVSIGNRWDVAKGYI